MAKKEDEYKNAPEEMEEKQYTRNKKKLRLKIIQRIIMMCFLLLVMLLVMAICCPKRIMDEPVTLIILTSVISVLTTALGSIIGSNTD